MKKLILLTVLLLTASAWGQYTFDAIAYGGAGDSPLNTFVPNYITDPAYFGTAPDLAHTSWPVFSLASPYSCTTLGSIWLHRVGDAADLYYESAAFGVGYWSIFNPPEFNAWMVSSGTITGTSSAPSVIEIQNITYDPGNALGASTGVRPIMHSPGTADITITSPSWNGLSIVIPAQLWSTCSVNDSAGSAAPKQQYAQIY